ncbi:unnamed protein product [Dracunculus medinensis]|uniref:Palmitoyltransferase n=1 Tax=Dracunculus medinensis TaxID=318479 RepID=A0A3P7PF56_DRAME|nr:unnamed protein product [Dracunculus medinensis]
MQILFFLVHFLLLIAILTEYLLFFPYENHIRPSVVLYFYFILGIYLIININFHYYKACNVDPGKPDQSQTRPWCYKCNNHKPERTHHCSICNRCILQMDHHCIWINQCVGLNNHRYFLQFVVFVWIAESVILFSNYTAFWEYFENLNVRIIPFCKEQMEWVLWQSWFCTEIPSLLNGCFCFNYGLAILLFFVLGGFSLWNIYLISLDETLIDFIGLRSTCFRDIFLNWRRFLGLINGRSFICHILLPSSHPQAFSFSRKRNLLNV